MLFGMTPSELWNSCSQVLVHLSLLHVLQEYVYTHTVLNCSGFFFSWMKCFTDAALRTLQKGGMLKFYFVWGFFSKVNYLWGTDLDMELMLSDTSKVNIMELTSPALILREVWMTILTTHRQLLHPHLVSLPHPLLVGHPSLLAEVCALTWSAVAGLTSLMQAKQLVLTASGICVNAQAAAHGVCNGSASQRFLFLVAFYLNTGRESFFPTMVIPPIFLL